VGQLALLRIAVLASGAGSNLQALLNRIATGHVSGRVVQVISDKPEAGALQLARAANVPNVAALPPAPGEKRAAYDQRLLAALNSQPLDVVVLAGYMRIVGPQLTSHFDGRMVNIHPSLLPAFKGLDAIGQAFRACATDVGCSTHLVTNDLDGGPILIQAGLKRRPQDTEATLRQRVLKLEHLILPRTVQLFAEGRIRRDGTIQPGASWKNRTDLDFVSGAWYSEAF
jgi:phosphoribosylglycinamide formyltransferase 1